MWMHVFLADVRTRLCHRACTCGACAHALPLPLPARSRALARTCAVRVRAHGTQWLCQSHVGSGALACSASCPTHSHPARLGVLWWCSPFCTTRGLLLCWASKDPTNRPLANERCSAAVLTPHGGRLPTVARLACVSAFTGVGSPHVPRPARGTNVPLACGRPRFVFPPGAQRRFGVAWRCCTRS